jgi:hypothetical protein
MIHLLILAVHLLATIAKLVRPGGVRVVVAESLLIKQQLLISSRARRRAPNLNSFDRFVLGLGSLFVVGRSSAPRPEGTVEGTHRRDRRVQARGLFQMPIAP